MVGKIPWKRERLTTPVFWPGEFHGLYSPWGLKELDMTEWLSFQSPSHVQLFATTWTVAARLLCSWDFPGKNTGVGCHFLLQGIFLTQGSNLCLLFDWQVLYHWTLGSLEAIHHQAKTLQSTHIQSNNDTWTLAFQCMVPRPAALVLPRSLKPLLLTQSAF